MSVQLLHRLPRCIGKPRLDSNASELEDVVSPVIPDSNRNKTEYNLHKKVADFLMSTPDKFINASVKEVATTAGVSEPTVVRFGRKIGCEGFKDLKIILAQHLAVKQALQDADYPLSGRQRGGTFINQICNAAIATLNQTTDNLNLEDLNKAAKIIANSRRVFIFGIGGSSAILAKEMHNRFFRLNLASTPYTDSYLQRMSASTLSSKDTAVFISSTGRPRSLIESAELAKHYGAKSIAITCADSSLARYVDLCLDVKLSQSGVAPDQPNPMRFAQLLVIDALAHQVAIHLGKQAQESLNRVRACIASMHGIVPQQPIGD